MEKKNQTKDVAGAGICLLAVPENALPCSAEQIEIGDTVFSARQDAGRAVLTRGVAGRRSARGIVYTAEGGILAGTAAAGESAAGTAESAAGHRLWRVPAQHRAPGAEIQDQPPVEHSPCAVLVPSWARPVDQDHVDALEAALGGSAAGAAAGSATGQGLLGAGRGVWRRWEYKGRTVVSSATIADLDESGSLVTDQGGLIAKPAMVRSAAEETLTGEPSFWVG